MDPHAARRDLFEMTGGLDNLLGPSFVEAPFRAHAADDPSSAHGDVGILVGQQDGRADSLVAAAGRIGAVDPGQDGDAQLFQFGMAEKGGPVAAPVRVDLLLFGQFDPGTVDQPDQGHPEPFGQIGHPELVFGLSGDPGPGHDLVVEADQDAPLAADPGQAVDHPGHAFFIVLGIVKGMQGAEGPGIDQVFDPVPDGHLPPFMYFFRRQSGVFNPFDLGRHFLQDRFDLGPVFGHLLDLSGL